MANSNPLIIFGAVLALGGIAAFAVPVFTTHQTDEVAHVGGLKVEAEEDHSHVIPPLVSGGAIVLGIVLIGAGVVRRQ